MGDRLARWGDGAASSGPTGLKSPHGITVAPNGEVYIADTANNRIVRRAPYPRDEVLGTIGRSGSGPGEMEYPIAVAVGPEGLVYVLEAVRNRVQAFTPDGSFVAQWPKHMRSDRNVEPGEIWMPQAVGGDGKHLFLLENDAPLDHVRVQVLDPRADVHLADSLLATFPEGPGPGLMQLWDPHGVAVASDGTIAVADSGNNRVVLYRWGDSAALPPTAPPATPTAPPTDTPAPPRPTDPPATASPTDEPATASPTDEPATASPTDEPATATPLPTSVPLTATRTATASAEPATPTATPSGLPPPATPTALPLTPTAAPSASPTDPPSANTRPTPFRDGKRLYLPLLVRNFRVGSRWR
jgi:hypothetical protein